MKVSVELRSKPQAAHFSGLGVLDSRVGALRIRLRAVGFRNKHCDNVGALTIRIGFWGPLYYNNKNNNNNSKGPKIV